MDGNNLNLDLNTIANTRIQDIEIIDITGVGNSLKLTLNDLLDVSSSTNILKVLGNSGDSVNIVDFSDSGTDETVDSITYDVYTHTNTDANAALWVQQDVSIVL